MIETKNTQFNTFNKGVNLMNTVFTFVIGYGTEKNTQYLKDKVNFLLDVKSSLLVLLASAAFAIAIGFFISLLIAKVESIRSTAVSEIMFIIFGTYLLSSIAFLEH